MAQKKSNELYKIPRQLTLREQISVHMEAQAALAMRNNELAKMLAHERAEVDRMRCELEMRPSLRDFDELRLKFEKEKRRRRK